MRAAPTLVLAAAALLGGCASHPSLVRWLPPEAHGSRPDLKVAGGGGNDQVILVRNGRAVGAYRTRKGEGGYVYLPIGD